MLRRGLLCGNFILTASEGDDIMQGWWRQSPSWRQYVISELPFGPFGQTDLGQRLDAIVKKNEDERYIEFRCVSRLPLPAVAALVYELKPLLEPYRQSKPAKFDEAKKWVGWRVGQVMRQHGHVITRRQARVLGGLFTVGAVWSPEPAT